MSSPVGIVGIGITTKNRWNDLAITLEHLQSSGLDAFQTLVIDDGSVSPMPAEFSQRFPWVKFERFEKSYGYIAQRNYIARSLGTPFYLSLDDDSFPVAGNLEAAATWLQEHPRVAVLGFRILGRKDPVPVDLPTWAPVAIRDFTGCGFLIRRDLLLSLGGFEERLEFYGEEMDYSLRLHHCGYEIFFFPAFVIMHMASNRERLAKARAYILIRNHVLMPLWLYPFPLSLFGGLWWTLLKSPFPDQTTLNDRWNHLSGALEGWMLSFRWFGAKHRLNYEQFRRWRSKPSIASL